MKSLSIAIIIAISSIGSTAFANSTAYEALRVVNSRNSAYANSTVEVSGVQGLPQPAVWRVVVNDPVARGGIREFEVSGGSILSERTPSGGRARSLQGESLTVSNLNLDSSGAFSVANKYAIQSQVGFDSVTYSLRYDAVTRTPIWAVQLLDINDVELAQLAINATTGNIVASQLTGATSYRSSTQDPYQTSEDGGFIGRASETARRVQETTGRGVRRGLGNVQEWFTGRRTIDSED